MFRPPTRKIIFVLPLVGESAANGESPALASAQQLTEAGAHVEVWTTTAGYSDSTINVEKYRPGKSSIGALAVQRFQCHARDERIYEGLKYRLLRGEELSDEEESRFFRHDIRSDALRDAIFKARQDSLFLFNPCVAATTVQGVAAAAVQSVLIPDLGQPLLGQVRLVRRTVETCHHFLFHSEPERLLAQNIFDLTDKHQLAASGIEGAHELSLADGSTDSAPFSKPFVIAHVTTEQSLARLCEFAAQMTADSLLPWSQVLLAAPPTSIPARYQDIIHRLGSTDDNLKHLTMSQATAYVHVSDAERVSPMMLQAWLHHCPVLAYSGSAIASAHVRLAQGGLCFDTYEEFRHAALGLARNAALRRSLGENGRRYVRRYFRWSIARERQMRFLREIEQGLK